jgi:hypothetical protein
VEWFPRQPADVRNYPRFTNSGVVIPHRRLASLFHYDIGIPLTQYENISRQFTLIYAAVIPVAFCLAGSWRVAPGTRTRRSSTVTPFMIRLASWQNLSIEPLAVIPLVSSKE